MYTIQSQSSNNSEPLKTGVLYKVGGKGYRRMSGKLTNIPFPFFIFTLWVPKLKWVSKTKLLSDVNFNPLYLYLLYLFPCILLRTILAIGTIPLISKTFRVWSNPFNTAPQLSASLLTPPLVFWIPLFFNSPRAVVWRVWLEVKNKFMVQLFNNNLLFSLNK